MIFKKFALAILSSILICGMVACGAQEDDWSRPDNTSASTTNKDDTLMKSNVLTGEKLDDESLRDKRFTAIMVNNIDKSRPTSGLSDASILFEIVTEGGITRFMALYDDYSDIPKVGSVRSARDQFLQLIIPWQAYYVHIGQSTVASEYLKNYDYKEYNLDGDTYGGELKSEEAAVKAGNIYWRDSTRLNEGFSSEYTAYTSGKAIESVIEKNDLNDSKNYTNNFLNFVSYDSPVRVLEGKEKKEIEIVYSENEYETYFEYNDSNKKYGMSQYNEHLGKVQKTIDEDNDEQIEFDNIITLYADMSVYPATDGLMKVDYTAGGTGYYFNQGKYEKVKWKKGDVEKPLTILNATTGEELEVNTGKTYVGIVDSTLENDFVESLEGNSTSDTSSTNRIVRSNSQSK